MRKKQSQSKEEHLLEFSLSSVNQDQLDLTNEGLNQTLPACLHHIDTEYGKVSRSMSKSKNTSRRRHFNSKLSKSLMKSSQRLSYLINNQHANILSNTTSNGRLKRTPNKLNPMKCRRRTQSNQHEDRENKPIQQQADNASTNKGNPHTKSSRPQRTLKEKSLNSMIMNCFDEVSNNSAGSSSDYLSESSVASSLSDGLNTYSLNLSFLNKINKEISDDSSASPVVAPISISSNKIMTGIPTPPENTKKLITNESDRANVVVVPSFRVKKFKPRYRIEGIENLNDDTFLKRHQKLENEEIKIQKWDMMRQRNEYEKNKALQKENRHLTKSNSKPNSTAPSVQSSPMKRPLTITESTSEEKITLTENDLYIIEKIDDHELTTNDHIETKQDFNSPEDKKPRGRKKRETIFTRLSIQSLINKKKRKREVSTSPLKRERGISTSPLKKTETPVKSRLTRSTPLTELNLKSLEVSSSPVQSIKKRRRII